jgi:uncharacterized protein (TIGR00369 family)
VADPEVPDGFEQIDPPSPFGELVGPLYLHTTGELPMVGVRVESQHLNRMGRGHGGLLTTVADIALSRAVVGTLPPGATMSTADLHIAFLDGAGEGQWLQATPSLDRIGRALVHASCELTADGRPVAKVLGCFAVRLP